MRRSKSSKSGAFLQLLFLGVLCASAIESAHAEGEKGVPSATGNPAASGSGGSAGGGITAPPNDPCFQDVLCKGHYQRARLFSKAGEFEAALTEYQIAFKQQPVPWLLLNIARTLHKIPRLPEAIEKYQRYLDMTQQSGDAELRGKAQEYLDQAKKELADRPPPEPAPAPLNAGPLLTLAPTDPPPLAKDKERTPIYKKWWFWTILVGSAAVVAGGVAGGVLAAQSKTPAVPTVPTDADAYRPMF